MDEAPPPGVIESPATPEIVKEETAVDEPQLNGDVQQDEERKYLKFYPYMTSKHFLPKLPKSFSNPLPSIQNPNFSDSINDSIQIFCGLLSSNFYKDQDVLFL